MGQSSSRLQQQPLQHTPATHSNTPSLVAGPSTDFQSDLPLDAGDASNVSRSRRSSLRKSILKFVKPSSIRNRVHSDATNPSDARRSWRNSRRWSKAHHHPVTLDEESPFPGPSSQFSTAESSTLAPCSVDKGKQREVIPSLDEPNDDPTPATVAETLPPSCPVPINESQICSTSTQLQFTDADADAPSSDDIHEDFPVECGSDTSSQRSSASSMLDTEPALIPPAPQLSTHPQQQPSNSSPRQFPPPGTLVVVQGIVHTTDVRSVNTTSPTSTNLADVSASQSIPTTDAPPDQSAPRSRNRLSALLRPRSSSRPVSAIISDSASTVATSTSHIESTAIAGSDSQSSPAGSLHTTMNSVESAHTDSPVHTPVPPPIAENPSPLVSSSSIDVLGTLLSVAAAATAASLLTGSSEPILSTGLAPPQPSIPSSLVSDPTTPSRPVSQSQSYADAERAGLVGTSVSGRSERMRQAWGTIRERLGLRPSNSPSHDDTRNRDDLDSSIGSADDGEDVGSPIDTRELMLAEMARAFNIGLGLNGLGEPHTPSADATNTSHPQTQLPGATSNAMNPPEGSFERFLVDLQVDLRVALTRNEGETDPEDPRPPPTASAEGPQHVRSLSDSPLPPLETSPIGMEGGSQQPDGGLDQPAGSVLLGRDSISNELGDSADLPFLQDMSDSESEADEDGHEEEEFEDDDFQSATQISLSDEGNQAPNSQPMRTTPGTGRIDAEGRINWWRLYRFPPIVSPHIEASRQSTTSSPTIPATTTPPFDSALLTSPTTPSTGDENPAESADNITTSESEASPLPPASRIQPPSQADANSVVPVIVVGLQSVNSEWRPDLPQHMGVESADHYGPPAFESGDHEEHDDLDGWGGRQHLGNGSGGTAEPGRSRGWHSRAADAIRNLRPGRRNAEAVLNEAAEPPSEMSGSRTFLIYVIGGYYPPDHNIVTGGPNILDSFEALLELADLLGQVKPPTVSKDEIEKSGLEIINASDLPRREKDGKVSSNCLDRCLICLDDYEPEDPIRVMSCRHAFHKSCVDEWLQRGRNNCPACRSTGVATDGHTPSPAAVS